jgi:hypothetical protein
MYACMHTRYVMHVRIFNLWVHMHACVYEYMLAYACNHAMYSHVCLSMHAYIDACGTWAMYVWSMYIYRQSYIRIHAHGSL